MEGALTVLDRVDRERGAVADLSDEELEKVAGGTEITLAIFGTVLAGAAVTGAVATGVVVGVKQGW